MPTGQKGLEGSNYKVDEFVESDKEAEEYKGVPPITVTIDGCNNREYHNQMEEMMLMKGDDMISRWCFHEIV